MFANRRVCGVLAPCAALCLLVVLAIVAYGAVLRRSGAKDPLARRLYHHPVCQEVDGWSVSHFLFFGLLGFFYPGQHAQFFVAGVLWEVVETCLGQNELQVSGRRLQLVGDQDAEGVSTGDDAAFWYGKESDIVMDVAGYAAGSALAERYWPNPLTSAASREALRARAGAR